jgi:hypothetical protein
MIIIKTNSQRPEDLMKTGKNFVFPSLIFCLLLSLASLPAQAKGYPTGKTDTESIFAGVGYAKAIDLDGFKDKDLAYRASIVTRGSEIGVIQTTIDASALAANVEGEAKYTVIFMGQSGSRNKNWGMAMGTAYVMEQIKTTPAGGATSSAKKNSWAVYGGVKYFKDKFMLALEYFHLLSKAQAKGLLCLTVNISFSKNK